MASPLAYHLPVGTDTTRIAANVRVFLDSLNAEMVRLGRSPDSVTLVAVSKTVGPEAVAAAASVGLTTFGENRVQEAKDKIPKIVTPDPLRWHLIGHLQTNKARDAVTLFDLIHSVDRYDLAAALDRRAAMSGKRQDILIQVNTIAESQKSGCEPGVLDELVARIALLPHVRMMGLMTIGPFASERPPIERSFRLLRRRFERLSQSNLGCGQMRYCSMGMTGDWPIALAEGANMLRIGRAIFGERT